MWVKKFYVRGDDDDDDDEIKTSMILRVHHISSWSCGFDKLSLALQTNHMARTTMNGLFVFQRLFQSIVDLSSDKIWHVDPQ